jgi:hypothetical protein
MAAFYDDREDEVLAIDDIVTSMRRVIDQPPAADRKRLGCSPAATGRTGCGERVVCRCGASWGAG